MHASSIDYYQIILNVPNRVIINDAIHHWPVEGMGGRISEVVSILSFSCTLIQICETKTFNKFLVIILSNFDIFKS